MDFQTVLLNSLREQRERERNENGRRETGKARHVLLSLRHQQTIRDSILEISRNREDREMD